MVYPYKSPEQRKRQQEMANKAESVGDPDDVKDLLKYGLGLVGISWLLLWGWVFYGYWQFMTF